MAFSTILIGTFVVYFIYYAVNFAYDLFVVPSQHSLHSQDEEIEIDEKENIISTSSFPSSSSSEFSSSTAGEEDFGYSDEDSSIYSPVETVEGEIVSNNSTAMNGGVFIEELFETVQNAQTPEELEFVNQVWHK